MRFLILLSVVGLVAVLACAKRPSPNSNSNSQTPGHKSHKQRGAQTLHGYSAKASKNSKGGKQQEPLKEETAAEEVATLPTKTYKSKPVPAFSGAKGLKSKTKPRVMTAVPKVKVPMLAKEEKAKDVVGSEVAELEQTSGKPLNSLVSVQVAEELTRLRLELAAEEEVERLRAAVEKRKYSAEAQRLRQAEKAARPPKAKKCLDIEFTEASVEPASSSTEAQDSSTARPAPVLQRCSCSCRPHNQTQSETVVQSRMGLSEEELAPVRGPAVVAAKPQPSLDLN